MNKWALLMMILALNACVVPVAPTQNAAIVPVSVLVKTVEKQDNAPVYVCTIKPFFELFAKFTNKIFQAA